MGSVLCRAGDRDVDGLAWTGVTIVGAVGRGHPHCPRAHGGPARVGGATEVHYVSGDVGRAVLFFNPSAWLADLADLVGAVIIDDTHLYGVLRTVDGEGTAEFGSLIPRRIVPVVA